MNKDLPKGAALRPVHLVLLLLILLLSFGLRVYQLDGQSLWSDEGASAVMAGRSLGQIVNNAAADIHPPLYYFLLRGWVPLAGESEFALRFPSLFLGVLLVALVFTLADRLFSISAGLISGFAAAIAPLLVYYSQEARMYMLMAVLAMLSTYLFLLLTGIVIQKRGVSKEWMLWPVYALITAAMLYTQYISFTILLLQNLVFIISFWRIDRQWRLWVTWVLSQAAIALVFLPWFLEVTGQVSVWQTSVSPLGLGELLGRAFLFLSLGSSGEAATAALPLFAVVLLGSLLWIPTGDRERESYHRLAPLLLISMWTLLPIFVMYLISLQRPMFHHKFLLLSAPSYCILLGLGIASLGTSGAGVVKLFAGSQRVFQAGSALVITLLLLILSLASFVSLHAYYFDSQYARDDYRGLAHYIERSSKPGDAIILNAPGQIEIFNYYYRGELPRYPLPRQRPIDVAATERELEEITKRHENIWLVLWAVAESDPDRIIENWLNGNNYRTFGRWFGGVELVRYSGSASAQAVSRSLDVNLGNEIRLTGYRIEEGGLLYAGDVLRLTLQWQARTTPQKRYKVFTHIVDGDGFIWGQHDSEPQGGARLTVDWRPGEVVQDRHGLLAYPGTPPGEYRIEVGLYDTMTGRRLPVVEGGDTAADRVLLGPVHILRPPEPVNLQSLSYHHAADTIFGKLRLLGYSLSDVGSSGAKTSFGKGDVALLALYWQALDRPGADYMLKVELRDKEGSLALSTQGEIARGTYPVRLLERGEVILGQHKLTLAVPEGTYDLLLAVTTDRGLVSPSGGKLPAVNEFVRLERITIQ
ncbi:MAG: glycosyltransferase family 39 protein [Chloroflexota bacterium]